MWPKGRSTFNLRRNPGPRKAWPLGRRGVPPAWSPTPSWPQQGSGWGTSRGGGWAEGTGFRISARPAVLNPHNRGRRQRVAGGWPAPPPGGGSDPTRREARVPSSRWPTRRAEVGGERVVASQAQAGVSPAGHWGRRVSALWNRWTRLRFPPRGPWPLG